jgi:hypothetical protein
VFYLKGIAMPRASKSQSSEPTGPRLVKKSAAPTPILEPTVTHEQIAIRAYEIFEQEGFAHGSHLDHWLRAERELVNVAPAPAKRAATRARR